MTELKARNWAQRVVAWTVLGVLWLTGQVTSYPGSGSASGGSGTTYTFTAPQLITAGTVISLNTDLGVATVTVGDGTTPGTIQVCQATADGSNCAAWGVSSATLTSTVEYDFPDADAPAVGRPMVFSTSSGGKSKATWGLAPAALASAGTCNSASEGVYRTITDSTTNTWGATITGLGANRVGGYCNGTNWTVAAK